MNKIVKFVFVLVMCLLSGCRPQNAEAPKDLETFSKNYLNLLQAGNISKAWSLVDPEIKKTINVNTFNKIHHYLKNKRIVRMNTIGLNVVKYPARELNGISYQVQFEDKEFMLYELTLQKIGENITVMGFNVQILKRSLQEINAFTLKNKTLKHYTMLFLVLCVLAVTFFALISCLRGNTERKWKWVLFIIFGFGQFSFNWTTGESTVKTLAVQLFGVSILQWSAFSPMIISVSFPLGAILFLVKKYKISI